jgi:hypothetical protein
MFCSRSVEPAAVADKYPLTGSQDLVERSMTPQSLHAVKSTLHALPVAVVFSKQLLLTWHMSDAAGQPVERSEGKFTLRATTLTAVLKNIEGYNHDGLNE